MGKPEKKKFIYPWRENNSFRLHIDSIQYFPRLLDLIEQARHYIIIEQYLVESGYHTSQLLNALVAAAQRDVSVLLLFDGFGAAGLNNHDRQFLQQANIYLQFYNPIKYRFWYKNLKRDHRKMVIIDHQAGMIGGAGFTDEFDYENNPGVWHDVMLEVSGPVIDDWFNSFATIWEQYAKMPQQVLACKPATEFNGDMAGHLAITQPLTHHGISRSVINHVQHSHHHVWLATPYFVITRKLRRELLRAVQRGVDVRLLLPGDNSDHPWVTHAFHNDYEKLLHQGIRIFEYQERFIHAKVFYCDKWVSIGSSNLDRWNKRWSLDANQEIASTAFCDVVENFFNTDFIKSHEITLAKWRQRGWVKRLREKFSRWFIILLEMIGRSYHR